MRADRLLSIMMLLQNRERITAQELAQELEVSVRTIYRDMIALSTAGIPVYCERGPGGGCHLVEDYRTTLTGLNKEEIQALLLLRIPQPLEELQAGKNLKTALLKVIASLPRGHEELSPRIYLDWAGWDRRRDNPPHLQTLYRAIWEERLVLVRFNTVNGVEIEAVIEPYGLVAKAGVWHLVYSTGGTPRQRRVADYIDVRLLAEKFLRPLDFDLEVFWKSLAEQLEQQRASIRVRVSCAPAIVQRLPVFFGRHNRSRVVGVEEPDASGWTVILVDFDYLDAARTRLLGLGGAVEVIEPVSLRLSLQDFARQVLRRYNPGNE